MSYYRHRELYSQCVACSICYEKRILQRPYESQYLPIPWEGELGDRARVLFLLEHPAFSKHSLRLVGPRGDAELVAELQGGFERNAVAFKRRRSSEAFRDYAHAVTATLLGSGPSEVHDYQSYLVSSLVRCDVHGETTERRKAAAWQCTTRHTLPLLDRLRHIEWIVAVGARTRRLLLSDGIWPTFSMELAGRMLPVPSAPEAASGSLGLYRLSEHIRCVTIPAWTSTQGTKTVQRHLERLRTAAFLPSPVFAANGLHAQASGSRMKRHGAGPPGSRTSVTTHTNHAGI